MKIGRMNRRIGIQSESRTPDGAGGYSRTWSTDTTVWGAVKTKSGNEFVRGEQATGIVSYEVTLRYRTGLTTANRLVIDSVYYNVRSIVNIDEGNKYLLLIVERGTAI